jgi:hypothetical protein
MKERKLTGMKANLVMVLICLALSGSIGLLAALAGAQTPAGTQEAGVGLPAGVEEVVKLTKAGMGEDLILTKVKKAGVSYDLTTDQIIYLKNQGVSEKVIAALLQAGPASAPSTAASTPSTSPPLPPPGTEGVTTGASMPPSPPSGVPPAPVSGESTVIPAPAGFAEPAVNFPYFQEQLAPYGTWVDAPGYGQCWQPFGLPPGWRPYYDGGHWVYTDAGLYWQSDYPWGAIPFHYGRWAWAGRYGWIWAPGYEYAPAWVLWRHTGKYLGWAPLPYGSVWVAAGWWEYRGVRVAVDYDFGLGPSFFVFINSDHLWEHDYRRFALRGGELNRIYRASAVNRFRRGEHGRFIYDGLERGHLERLTGRRVEEVRHEELRSREREVLRVDRKRLAAPHRRPHPGERR